MKDAIELIKNKIDYIYSDMYHLQGEKDIAKKKLEKIESDIKGKERKINELKRAIEKLTE